MLDSLMKKRKAIRLTGRILLGDGQPAMQSSPPGHHCMRQIAGDAKLSGHHRDGQQVMQSFLDFTGIYSPRCRAFRTSSGWIVGDAGFPDFTGMDSWRWRAHRADIFIQFVGLCPPPPDSDPAGEDGWIGLPAVHQSTTHHSLLGRRFIIIS